MELRRSASEDQSGVPSPPPALPPWLRHTTRHLPERGARMLEHMARSRALRDHQAADSPAALEPSRKGAGDYLSGFISHMVLFGLIGLVFQSRFPLCLGAFLFFTDGEFVEWMLRKFGIRFEPDTIGPDVIRCFAFFFGWGMLCWPMERRRTGVAVAVDAADRVAVVYCRRRSHDCRRRSRLGRHHAAHLAMGRTADWAEQPGLDGDPDAGRSRPAGSCRLFNFNDHEWARRRSSHSFAALTHMPPVYYRPSHLPEIYPFS